MKQDRIIKLWVFGLITLVFWSFAFHALYFTAGYSDLIDVKMKMDCDYYSYYRHGSHANGLIATWRGEDFEGCGIK